MLFARIFPFYFELQFLVKPESLLPTLNTMARLLNRVFITAKFENQKRICHALNMGGHGLPCQGACRTFLRLRAHILNLANRRVDLDDSQTFGGFHWNNPRGIFAELYATGSTTETGNARVAP
jgi:hypothetical protein